MQEPSTHHKQSTSGIQLDWLYMESASAYTDLLNRASLLGSTASYSSGVMSGLTKAANEYPTIPVAEKPYTDGKIVFKAGLGYFVWLLLCTFV